MVKKATKGKGAGGQKPAKNVRPMSAFEWDRQKSVAAIGLAEGKTQQEVASDLEISDRTIRRWLQDIEFAAEVDRLSLMVGIASRAERLRLAQRVVRQKSEGGLVVTDKDLLDWLKYAQSETDGIKLDLVTVAAAFGQDVASLAPSRQGGSGETAARDGANTAGKP